MVGRDMELANILERTIGAGAPEYRITISTKTYSELIKRLLAIDNLQVCSHLNQNS